MFPQTKKVLKDSYLALLCLNQICIPEDYGVNLLRLVVVVVLIFSVLPHIGILFQFLISFTCDLQSKQHNMVILLGP
jgi:hypothetical protein